MDLLTIPQLKRAAAIGLIEARVHAQVQSAVMKNTRDQKPYRELLFADGEDRFTLRVWHDAPAFEQCAELADGDFIEITGEFLHNANFGIEARRWRCRALTGEERDALLAGSPA